MAIENRQIKQLSYLHARDPSILSWNKPLDNIKKNLNCELMEETTEEKKDDNHIQVYLRVKKAPHDLYKIEDNILTCKVPEGSHVLRNIKEGDTIKKKYTFSQIFGPQSSQIDIFNNIVKEKMLSFINGDNNTLLTYGASGAGKTFTVVGTAQQPGLIPRALEYLFRTIPQLSKQTVVKPLPTGNVIKLNETQCRQEKELRGNLLNNSAVLSDRAQHMKTYKQMQQRLSNEPVAELEDISNISLGVWISFAEIYNENIYDLLQPDLPRGKQRPILRLGNANGHIYIKNLTSINVTCGMDAYQILQYGIQNLNYAATKINSHSSRSHSIFTIKLVQLSEIDGGKHINYFNFCDLAGSERTKKTMNEGDRLKESNNINTSLLVLGRCINVVRNSQKQNDQQLVPFRESKLTQLFQRALSGFETIAMIVNINPCREMFDETHHVLNFSAIAKDIAIIQKPIEVKPRKNNRFSKYMELNSSNVSTANEDIEEDDMNSLRSIIVQLQEEIELVRTEGEQNEIMARNYVITGYKKILEENDAAWEERFDSVKKRMKLEYDMKIQSIKEHYENLLKEQPKEMMIINLDDSREETIEEQTNIITSLQQELAVVKCENESLRAELEEKIKRHIEEYNKLKEENHELIKTLQDADCDYKELEELLELTKSESNDMYADNIQLQEKLSELEMNIHQYSLKLENESKKVEELEDKLRTSDLEYEPKLDLEQCKTEKNDPASEDEKTYIFENTNPSFCDDENHSQFEVTQEI